MLKLNEHKSIFLFVSFLKCKKWLDVCLLFCLLIKCPVFIDEINVKNVFEKFVNQVLLDKKYEWKFKVMYWKLIKFSSWIVLKVVIDKF